MDGIPNIENPLILEFNSLANIIMRYIMSVNSGMGSSNSLSVKGNADVLEMSAGGIRAV